MAPGSRGTLLRLRRRGSAFRSGHVLALRRFTASSIGPGYSAIWLRSPQGAWSMWIDTEPMKACPRYFGSELERVIEAPIALSWPDHSE
jgi:hypothetical protein